MKFNESLTILLLPLLLSGALGRSLPRPLVSSGQNESSPFGGAPRVPVEASPGEDRAAELGENRRQSLTAALEDPITPWIEGRVAIPEGSEPDESLTVVVLGPELPATDHGGSLFADRSWDRHEVLGKAPVEADGSFRVGLPRSQSLDTEALWLDLDGRYLFLGEPLALDQTTLDGPVRLDAELGGAIRGRILLPPGCDEAPKSVGMGSFGSSFSGAGMARGLVLEGSLDFELHALAPDLSYTVWANPDIYPGARYPEELLVGAGECVEIQIHLQRGATVRGRVLDASGAPVARATILGNAGASYATRPGSGTTQSDVDGRFELRGLAPGSQTLSSSAEGLLSATCDELTLVDGEVREGVQITMEAGLSLAGTVQWPAGLGVPGVRVVVIPHELAGDGWRVYERARSEEGSAESAKDGSFQVSNLPPGSYAVYADVTRADSSGKVSSWSARLNAVAAGTSDLRLTLSPSVACSGRVLDDEGNAIDAFTVTARREDWPAFMEGPSREVEQSFTGAAGEFVLTGLDRGSWMVSTRAAEHLLGEPRLVEVETPTKWKDPFELTRTASITGKVLDPTGAPVPGAEIRLSALSPVGRDGVVETDAEGQFHLTSVGPGPIMFGATSDEWAPSDEEELELEPGGELTGWSIHLSAGGHVAGVVYDGNGLPDAGQTILLQSNQHGGREVVSDEHGHFRIEHLAPGPYQVMAAPGSDDWTSQADFGDMLEDLRMATAHVVEGETVEIAMGAPPRDPVWIHGHVSRAGRPFANAGFLVVPETGRFLDGMCAGTTGDDGKFELRLDEPGGYTFVLMASEKLETEVNFQINVPKGERHEFNLELPRGSIAGLLRGPDGAPVNEGMLWLRRQDSTSDLAAAMAHSTSPVGEDGSFLFEMLHPGRYSISAVAPEASVGTWHDIVVTADRRTGGIDLNLAQAGRVTGTVVDEGGRAIRGANVTLSDDHGRILYQLEATTDHEGHFSIERVPIGQVRVNARTEQQVSYEPAVAVVSTGRAAQVELCLRKGVFLRVVLRDGDDLPTRAAIRVENGSGYDYAGRETAGEVEQITSQGTATERRVGPVPPGRYTVSASTADGSHARQRVAVQGAIEEQEVLLRLVGDRTP